MNGVTTDNHADTSNEVRTVKCSMCRKVKTSDHFINPNSNTLFHVCDYCRYLRKTKYKKRRVRVELERPASSLSRTRESTVNKPNRSYQGNSTVTPRQETEGVSVVAPKAQNYVGIIPSRNWVEVSSNMSVPQSAPNQSVKYQPDTQYVLNHPYYRYQNILSSMCSPPQVVYNDKNQVVVLPSCIPPTPKSLIFCFNTSLYGNHFSPYDRFVLYNKNH